MGVFRNESIPGERVWVSGRVFLVLVGSFIFLTAAVYLQTGQEIVDRSYRVVGSRVVLPGRAAFRVVGFVDRESKDIPLEVTGAFLRTADGETPLENVVVSGRGPVDVVMDLPAQAAGAVLGLHVAGKAGVRTLEVPLEWGRAADSKWEVGPDTERADVLEGEFRVDVVPVGGVLVSSVANTLLIRVRDADGRAVPGAQVTLKFGNKEEGTVGVTDRAGLWSVDVPAGPGALSVQLAVKTSDGRASQHERLIPVTYAKTRLIPPGAIAGVHGATSTIQIVSFNDFGTVFCDVWEGRVLRHAWSLPLVDGRAELPLSALSLNDHCSLQCYYHVSDPGTIPARGAVLRGVPGDSTSIRELFAGASIDTPYLASLPSDASFSEAEKDRLWSWWFSSLDIPVLVPALLLDTLQLDKQLLTEQTVKTRRWLMWTLIGLFSALFVWMMTVIVMGQKRLQASYNAYRSENPDEDGELAMASFSRRGGRMPLWVIGAIIAANVIALLLLLMLVTGGP